MTIQEIRKKAEKALKRFHYIKWTKKQIDGYKFGWMEGYIKHYRETFKTKK